MCTGCVAREVYNAGGEWPPLTEAMIFTYGLIREFYGMHECETGGPLHIVVDDSNVKDSHLAFCRTECGREEWTEEVREAGKKILSELEAMTVVERSVAVNLDAFVGIDGDKGFAHYPPDWDLDEMFITELYDDD